LVARTAKLDALGPSPASGRDLGTFPPGEHRAGEEAEMPPKLCAEARRGDGETIIEIAGEIDAETVPLLRTELENAAGPDAALVTLDVGEVAFIDSTGMGAIVGAWKRFQREGRALRLTNASEPLLRRLHIMGLTHLLGVSGGELTVS
jgi:anti-sigma B factor antagonist